MYRRRRLFRMAITSRSSLLSVTHKYFVGEIFVGEIFADMCQRENFTIPELYFITSDTYMSWRKSLRLSFACVATTFTKSHHN